MKLTYFKRYRMEIPLGFPLFERSDLPVDYEMVPWSPALLEIHADTKYRSFYNELDTEVFPCLGTADGCMQVMRRIVARSGFLPGATWLVRYNDPDGGLPEYCGTIQGVRDEHGLGAIQNLGVTRGHRGQGLATNLMYYALQGFREAGLKKATLEVTAENTAAVRLYCRLGFRRERTVYKVAEVAYPSENG